MAYTVIARRYRSQTFDDVVGQDAVAQTMRNAIELGRVAHAYLFCGTRGVGKTTMARILAKSLNCLEAEGPTVAPCLKCDSCVSVNQGEDIDVIEIDGASNTGVDNIRQLRENAIYRPARARFKIYIIDEVHMLSTGAFNALLKILEEPPEHVKFIFATTEPNKVLATIQSRCQRFDFQNIGAETIGQQLVKILGDEQITFEKDLIVLLSRMANGSMRDALSLLDQLISAGHQPLTADQLNALVGVPDRQKVLNLLNAIGSSNGAGTLDAIEQLIDAGQSSGQVCDLLIENMRDLMVFLTAGADSKVLILTDEEKQQLTELVSYFDVASLIYNITALEKLRWTLRTSETSRALLEASLLRLALSEHFMGLAQLSGRLSASPAAAMPVKKNAIANTPQPVPLPRANNATDTAPTTQPELSSNVSADLNSIRASWSQILAQCASQDVSLGNFLRQGTPGDLTHSALQILFDTSGTGQLARQMCQGKIDKIEKLLSNALGANIKVRLDLGQPPKMTPVAPVPVQAAPRTVVSTPAQPAPEPASAPQPEPSAAAARVNRHEQSEVLNDPAVQMVLKGLEARPVEIVKAEINTDDIQETDEEEMD